jgi:hypothetical protein
MSKTFEEIVVDVYRSLTLDSVQWSIDGKRGYVTKDNVRNVLERGLQALYGAPPASTLLVGGILVYKWDENHYDIYVRKGEVEGVEDNQHNNEGSTG